MEFCLLIVVKNNLQHSMHNSALLKIKFIALLEIYLSVC
jgi:hypothetical protein